MERMIERTLSFAKIRVYVKCLGSDYQIVVEGGERPHLGSTVLAIPRPSLSGDGSVSCTSSVINVPGHKDEHICRILAERVAIKKNAVAMCTGGFHVDRITNEQIEEVIEVMGEIAEEI